jgi:hypothetical protein
MNIYMQRALTWCHIGHSLKRRKHHKMTVESYEQIALHVLNKVEHYLLVLRTSTMHSTSSRTMAGGASDSTSGADLASLLLGVGDDCSVQA